MTKQKAQNIYIFTGGTISSGNVPGYILDNFQTSLFKNYDQNETYLYPIYDMRYLVLASAIEYHKELTPHEKKKLLNLLKDSSIIMMRHNLQKENYADEVTSLLNLIIKQIPGCNNIDQLMLDSNIDPKTYDPYTIDSINFSFEDHYDKLRQVTISALKGEDSKAVIIVGGTDTRAFYAGLLSRDMQNLGLLQKNKLIFVSSMQNFDESPQHVAGLIKSVEIFSLQKDLNGAYVFSAENDVATRVRVHDMLGGDVVKISAIMSDSARSKSISGVVDNHYGTFDSASYRSLNINKDRSNKKFDINEPIKLARILPPLSYNNDIKAINAYLQHAISLGKENIDAVMLEAPFNDEDEYSKSDIRMLADKISILKNMGVRTYIFNPDIYHKDVDALEPQKIRPLYNNKIWLTLPENEIMENAGAEICYGSTEIGIYLDALLDEPLQAQISGDNLKKIVNNTIDKSLSISIKYVPSELFATGLKIAGKIAKNVIVDALPCNAVRANEAIIEAANSVKESGGRLFAAFPYNHAKIVEKKIESPYAAAQVMAKSFWSEKNMTPQDWLEYLKREQDLQTYAKKYEQELLEGTNSLKI